MMSDYEKYIDIAAQVLGEDQDWMCFKKIMLRTLPSRLRKNFSTRHPISKKQSLNSFEKNLINTYYNKTGVMLVLENKDGN